MMIATSFLERLGAFASDSRTQGSQVRMVGRFEALVTPPLWALLKCNSAAHEIGTPFPPDRWEYLGL